MQTEKSEQEIESINAAIDAGDVEALRKLLEAGCRANPEWTKDEFLLYDNNVGYYFRFAGESDFPLLRDFQTLAR